MSYRQSEIQDAGRCTRSWFLDYEYPRREGLPDVKPRLPGVRELGTLIHGGLAARNLGHPIDGGIFQALVAEAGHPDDMEELPRSEWTKANSTAISVVNGFDDWASSNGVEVGEDLRAVEGKLDIDLGDSVVTMTIDVAVASTAYAGGEIIRDYKTGKAFKKVHPIDFQLLTYAWGWWRQTGRVPAAAQYSQLRTVGQGANSKPPYYRQGDEDTIHISKELLVNHENNLRTLLNRMSLTCYDVDAGLPIAQVLTPTTTGECSWRCDVYDACVAMSHGEDWESILQIERTSR